jgi:hypothetical protein
MNKAETVSGCRTLEGNPRTEMSNNKIRIENSRTTIIESKKVENSTK